MTSARSMFTEAIEDHLALKRQNSRLEHEMPLSQFEVGDPLDRYPGGPVRPAISSSDEAGEQPALDVMASDRRAEPEQSAAEATMVATPMSERDDEDEPAGASAQVLEAEFRRPLEPLNGMAPMLSLVEDIDEEDVISTATPTPMIDLDEELADTGETGSFDAVSAPVLRFPGGVGPRGAIAVQDPAEADEHPVIVIDADEPLAPTDLESTIIEPMEPGGRKRPSFFNLLKRKRKHDGDGATGGGDNGWFSGNPREFTWDD